MAEHYRDVAQFWTPDHDSYTSLGQLYVDNPEFEADTRQGPPASRSTRATPPPPTPTSP